MIEIQSLDQMLDVGVRLILEQIPHDQINFTEELVVTIRIQGPTWDGTIDYRGANFILELQRAVNQLYIELHGETIPLRGLSKLVRVRVNVVKGSTNWQVIIGEALNRMVGNMTGGETLVFAGICAVAIGAGYTVKKILDYKKEVTLAAQAAKKDERIVERLTSTIDKALDVIERRDLEAPTRKLIGRLDEQDTITLPNRDPMPAEAAKQLYPRKPRSSQKSGRFDATYTIKNIDLSETPPIFTIVYNDLEFDAAAELAAPDIEQFVQGLEETLKTKTSFSVSLHVFVLYNDHKIISASIQGTGAPREGTDNIDTLFLIG